MLDEFYFIIAIGDFGFLSANSFVFIAHDFNACLAICAEEGQASWHNNHWISTDNISLGFSQGDQIKVSCPVFVTDPWSPEGDDFNFAENLLVVDVDEGNNRKTTSQTYSSNNEGIESCLEFDFPKITENILLDFLPHVVVGFLDLALGTGVFILDLEWVKNVLPDIEGSVSVSEGENDEGRIDADNAFNVNGFFLDNVGVNGFVGAVAHFTDPVHKIRLVVSTNDQRIGKGHLIFIGKSDSKISQEQQHQSCFHQVINLLQLYFQMHPHKSCILKINLMLTILFI